MTVAATGACHVQYTLTGLDLAAHYTLAVRAVCARAAAYYPSRWSAPSGAVLTLVAPPLVDQHVRARDIITGACGASALYGGTLLANRKCAAAATRRRCSGSPRPRFTRAPHGRQARAHARRERPGGRLLFDARGGLERRARAAVFFARSLRSRAPPPPHSLSFDA